MTYAGLTVAYWTVIVVALLPIGCAALAKWGMFAKPRRDGGYDNHDPRAWMARQGGWRARANAAQANCFEAMPFYIGAVIIAHQHGAFQMRLDLMAFLYVLLRLIYILFYLADMATLRSTAWTLALAINIAILFI
ncbi:MAPEG family protein [Hydrogenophaga sp. RWCD_12]|uniref:MAPEG family protein n=1 Tax=Hydrogenophaga sp. RWCD_12 TaxID=3391190 RepID=UPI0039851EC2